MLDLLLEKYPKFLNKFREYSREDDVFCEAVDVYIREKDIEMHPLSEEIQTTYNTNTSYNGNEFDITFSDASNFILAKNKTTEDDHTNQAHIFIFSKVGRTKMNCHIRDYKENPFPIDFLPTGIGLVENFFNEEKNLIVYELKFGTWEPSDAQNTTPLNSILNLFPVVLKKDEPSIVIKFIQNEEDSRIDIQFNSDKSGADNFYIDFRIDKKMSILKISAEMDPIKLKNHASEDLEKTITSLINDSVSEWLSQSIDLENLLSEADSDEIKIIYAPAPHASQKIYRNLNEIKKDSGPNFIKAKIHPKLEELDEIEKCTEGESRVRSNPNQKIKNPEAENLKIREWIIGKRT